MYERGWTFAEVASARAEMRRSWRSVVFVTTEEICLAPRAPLGVVRNNTERERAVIARARGEKTARRWRGMCARRENLLLSRPCEKEKFGFRLPFRPLSEGHERISHSVVDFRVSRPRCPSPRNTQAARKKCEDPSLPSRRRVSLFRRARDVSEECGAILPSFLLRATQDRHVRVVVQSRLNFQTPMHVRGNLSSFLLAVSRSISPFLLPARAHAAADERKIKAKRKRAKRSGDGGKEKRKKL